MIDLYGAGWWDELILFTSFYHISRTTDSTEQEDGIDGHFPRMTNLMEQ
jgi:hypothetical protein